MALDKGAANRFIKSAIASISSQRPPGQDEGTSSQPDHGGGDQNIPIKVTSKMIARAEYEKQLREAGSEEEDELDVQDLECDSDEMDAQRSGFSENEGWGFHTGDVIESLFRKAAETVRSRLPELYVPNGPFLRPC